MVQTSIIAAVCVLGAVIVHGHPGPHAVPSSKLLHERSAKAEKCASQIGAMKQKRHLERKRDITDYTIHAEAPKYDFIKNKTCILTPEVDQGPYWYPPSELLRQDVTEDQAGVPLELEIGLIDVSTCEPLKDALISIWHCNATGSYSSFEYDPNTPFGDLLKQKGVNTTKTPYDSIENFAFLANSNTTFLRGMWPTDANGVTSFSTIFPGFYVERTLHIHAQVHNNWNITKNGTIADGSRVVETGQIFFPEDVTAEIMKVEPYSSHVEVERYTNDIDDIWQTAATTGAMTDLDVEPLDGEDFKNGVLGYITLGIDTSTIKIGNCNEC